jgi:hypothetical protein
VNKKIFIINSILVIGMAGILYLAYNTWFNPPYPPLAGIDSMSGATKKFEPPSPIRENYPPTLADTISQQNLFRKERAEYVPPPPPPPPPPAQAAPPPPPKPVAPPPKLKVSGLMDFGKEKKVAVLEGTYSVLNGEKIEDKPLKKKGYNIGEQIGTYHITEIGRTSVSLDNKEGSVIKVSLVTRPEEDQIKRNGFHFFHKSKNPRPPPPASPVEVGTPIPSAPHSPQPGQPPARASGAATPAPAPQANRAPAPPMSELERVSGARSQTNVFAPGGISGAPLPAEGARVSGG